MKGKNKNSVSCLTESVGFTSTLTTGKYLILHPNLRSELVVFIVA